MPQENTSKHIEMLSKALKERNKEALEYIHTHYYHRIRSYISASIHSGQDAEDLTQNVFTELCKKNGQNKNYDNPEAYIFGISRKIINQYARNNNKSVKTIPITSINEPNTDKTGQKDIYERILLSERKQIINDAVEKLPPKAREAIKLRFIEGLSSKEAAQKAGCPQKSFRRLLSLAVKALRIRTDGMKNTSLKRYFSDISS